MQPTTTKVPNQGKVTVGNTDTAILSANSGRQQLWITNGSDEIIWITFGQTAVLNEGLGIPAGGGVVIDSEINTNAIRGICSSGGKVISYLEITN